MKVLVLGASGMLGHKLVQQWKARFEVFATVRGTRAEWAPYGFLDGAEVCENVRAEEFDTVRRAIEAVAPDVVFNAVGIIKQLPTSKNVVQTLTVNSIFPHRLAETVEGTGTRLINIGTDCVFDGRQGNYTEDDPASAGDLYGRSKHFGEVTAAGCLTLRTSIIGRELRTRHSLVEWFLANRGGKVKGFANALYSGFPTVVLADIIADLIEHHKELCGLYHVSSETIGKLELLQMLNGAYGAGVEIEPEYEFRIDRSLDSARFRRATGFRPDAWPAMIERLAADPTPYDKWNK